MCWLQRILVPPHVKKIIGRTKIPFSFVANPLTTVKYQLLCISMFHNLYISNELELLHACNVKKFIWTRVADLRVQTIQIQPSSKKRVKIRERKKFGYGSDFLRFSLQICLTEHFWDTQYKNILDFFHFEKNLPTKSNWNNFWITWFFFPDFWAPFSIKDISIFHFNIQPQAEIILNIIKCF